MSARGHGAGRRWAVVIALVALLLALPALVGLWPARDVAVSAAQLRSAVLASGRLGFSGFAESAGGLALPVTRQLTSVADLFSDRTTMRVWWRGPHANRVDVVTGSGETGIHRDGAGSWTWEFEAGRVTRGGPDLLTLPSPPDLLPSTLGRRLLSEAADDEMSRIGARRVAGRDALGLRLVPSAEAASVRRVDVWVDAATGLPLQVQAFAAGAARPAIDTRFLDLDLTPPPASVIRFDPPPGALLGTSPERGVLEEADRRLARVSLPASLAGLERRSVEGAPEAIGLYGRGVTLLAVVPVPRRLAFSLRQVITASPDAVVDALGVRTAAGPLGLMLVDSADGGSYVLTGTVTLTALEGAARELQL